MIYNELTRRLFENPGSVGTLEGTTCARGAAGSRAQGTWVQFDVRLTASHAVGAVRFQAFGCPHVIAGAALIAEEAVGTGTTPSAAHGARALRERLEAPLEKLGRLLVVEDAWRAALTAAGPCESP
jgi:NifU-like protein involved in Fe-S cluster formation